MEKDINSIEEIKILVARLFSDKNHKVGSNDVEYEKIKKKRYCMHMITVVLPLSRRLKYYASTILSKNSYSDKVGAVMKDYMGWKGRVKISFKSPETKINLKK